jgi:hypothetical protein
MTSAAAGSVDADVAAGAQLAHDDRGVGLVHLAADGGRGRASFIWQPRVSLAVAPPWAQGGATSAT